MVISRRGLVRAVGASLAAGVAGCGGGPRSGRATPGDKPATPTGDAGIEISVSKGLPYGAVSIDQGYDKEANELAVEATLRNDTGETRTVYAVLVSPWTSQRPHLPTATRLESPTDVAPGETISFEVTLASLFPGGQGKQLVGYTLGLYEGPVSMGGTRGDPRATLMDDTVDGLAVEALDSGVVDGSFTVTATIENTGDQKTDAASYDYDVAPFDADGHLVLEATGGAESTEVAPGDTVDLQFPMQAPPKVPTSADPEDVESYLFSLSCDGRAATGVYCE